MRMVRPGGKRTCRAPGERVGEAAQADYSSDYECSHGVDATRRAMCDGLIYAPGPTLGKGRRFNKQGTN
jgi:hypothetical protein